MSDANLQVVHTRGPKSESPSDSSNAAGLGLKLGLWAFENAYMTTLSESFGAKNARS